MNNKIILAIVFVLLIALSVGTIYASDVNDTDSYTANLNDSAQEISLNSVQSDDTESSDILESDNSSILSTNVEASDVISSSSSSITAKDITKYYKGSTKYTATFLDASGNALANTNVKITVNGVSYTKTTNSKGVASMDINLKPGTYKVVATNPVTGYNLATTFKILSTITAKNIKKVYLDGNKFSAKFFKKNGKVLANKKIKFKINKKTYTVKTNSKGVAKLSLKYLQKGTYKIISYNRDGLTLTKTVKVIKSSKTSLTTKTYTFLKSATKKIKVTLLNKYNYAPPKGKIIKFKINGKKYTAKTNKNGVAKLKLPSLKAGTYKVKYSFAKSGNYKASSAKNKVYVIPSKNPTYTVKSTKTFGYGAGTSFKVALTSGSVPLVNKKVKLTVNGVSYTKTTNSKGIVSLPINLAIGTYKISYSNSADSKINAKSGSTTINVIQRGATSITWKSSTSFNQGTQTCKLLVLNSNSKAISGGTVKLTVNSKTYTATTSSSGYATFKINFPYGNYSVSYTYSGDNLNAPSSGKTSLKVTQITTVSIKDIATAATTLKTYYANNKKLPSTVTAGGITFTVPSFLYLMCKAIYQIGNSKTSNIAFISGVSAPTSPTGDTINGAQLSKANYLTVAKNAADFISTNKRAPNYASSAVGKIIYTELVDATSRILAFYKTNSRLPSYCTITYSSGSDSQSGTGLNEDNTVSDLTPYLKSTTNCQVGNSAIKKIVKSVTSGLTSASAKAKAIYNYVRDSISYTFYSNTKYGAVGTLNAKTGNCVDQAHLLIAMFRTAGLPARYVHGTCKFSSGNTYGHVWAQVLVNGKWYVADPTSSKNSLGSVANWNTKSFTLKGIYAGISF